ncbi:MAG: hypothetical protein AMXMBFR46_17100 [Acidimicrobiia bacterium]
MLGGSGHLEEGDLTDLHPGVEGDRQVGDVRQLEREVTVEPRVHEPRGRVGEQPEASERALAVETGGEVVGQHHPLERRRENELSRVEDERVGVAHLHELGEVLLGLLRVDEGRGVVAEHPEVAVDAQVDRRRLDRPVHHRLDDDAPRGDGLADRDVGQDHEA